MIQQTLQQIIDTKTKPLGALGRLEELALQIGTIQNTTHPKITDPQVVVFAADHGIAATGLVNPYPQAVTAQMVKNFLAGGAAINVFCRQHHIGLTIVDVGINTSWTEAEKQRDGFVAAPVGKGTKNYMNDAAMTAQECALAMTTGRSVVKGIKGSGSNCIGFGEMGIGNTSSAALIMSAVLSLPITDCVGRGTGVSDAQLAVKIKTLEAIAQRHNLTLLQNNPEALLQAVGGFEIAAMCGAYLQAAAEKLLIVVDGFISTAALLVAHQMQPGILEYCVFAHCSGEQGHARLLQHLGVQPLLDLGLRLGEGTGAALAMPLLCSAVLFLNEMASFAAAGVSTGTKK